MPICIIIIQTIQGFLKILTLTPIGKRSSNNTVEIPMNVIIRGKGVHNSGLNKPA